MDLEFDKEMDALLRRAAGRGVLVGDDPKKHMDADAIAAFAENALPEKSRMIYTQHLAVCKPCRTTLAGLITLNAESEPAMAAAAAPATAASVPWYRALFASRNLAYTMGALVLVFGGLLGFIVLRNSYLGENTTLSKVEDVQTAQNAPARAEGANSLTSTTNANSNSTGIEPGEIPRSVGVADEQLPAEPNAIAAPPPGFSAASNTAGAPDKDQSPVGLDKEKAAAGQPAEPVDAPKREEEERAKNEVKLAATEQEMRKQDAAGNVFRNQQNQMTPGAGNKTTGPSRADVQRDNRAYDARQLDDRALMKAKKSESPAVAAESTDSVTATVKRAGGKTFELKQGVWYDTAFQGQKTKNVRRSSDDYRKLDGGLRSIADTIGGTVVVIWNGKAFRVQ
ncbi:MAG: hypothetical protein DMF62_09510 [Acidobacteria bacterium]|nr:MAG: hypothetical protein DMF62_09510 [Acidobacteriota bacterium]